MADTYSPRVAGNVRTSFIGRDREITAILDLLADDQCRLLTVTGLGGCGKTRLSIEAARRIAAGEKTKFYFTDGVYFIDLQSISSVKDIYPAIATAIGFDFYDARDPEQQLIHYLNGKSFLLVLDNLEHLDGAADLVASLLGREGPLKILATSRAPLFLAEEWLFQLNGMPIPAIDDDNFGQYDSVRLFIERARRVRHDFALAEDRDCVIAICRLVEGMPLAIELAAGWLRRLSCQDIAQELGRNLDGLVSSIRGVPERQRNLRAVFDYSWQLLTLDEQDLFMKLAVFHGGFQREAVEVIAGAALAPLAALVDKSMVGSPVDDRYQLHELSRRYAEEQLAAHPTLGKEMRDRHCTYYCAIVDQPYSFYYGRQGKENLAMIDAEIGNVRAAWEWAAANQRWRDLYRAIPGLYNYAFLRYWHQGLQRAFSKAQSALEAAAADRERDVALGQLLAFVSSFGLWMGRLAEARDAVERSIVLLERHGAQRELANAAVSKAWLSRYERGRDPEKSRALILKAAEMTGTIGQYGLQAFMYAMLAGLLYDIGKFEESEGWYKKALTISRGIDDPRGIATVMSSLGRMKMVLGEFDTARAYLLESLQVSREVAFKVFVIGTLTKLGQLETAVGNWTQAAAYLEESLAEVSDWARPYELANALMGMAVLKAALGEYDVAKSLYAENVPSIEKSSQLMAEKLWGLGRIAAREGKLAQAKQLHLESCAISSERGDRLSTARNKVALAHIALLDAEVVEARQQLGRALAESYQIRAKPLILDVLVGVAELFVLEDERERALELVELIVQYPAATAESKERAHEILNELIDPGQVSTIGTTRKFDLDETVTALLTKFESERDGPTGVSEANRALLEPLSERELELLRLVAAGKSNREIAAELVIALGTVKSHLHNIYQKLDVDSRTQAAARGRELGLI